MRSVLILLLAVLAGPIDRARADITRVPLEEAQKATLLLNNALGDLADGPFRLEVNAFKPCALMGSDHQGALVVPAYSLEKRIGAARRKTPVPAGQLWLRGVVPLVDGKTAPSENLRTVKVKAKDEEMDVSMYHLAFQKYGRGGKLLIYGQGKKPLLEIMLKPMTVTQETPIELEVKQADDGKPHLVFHVVGKFEGLLPLGHAD